VYSRFVRTVNETRMWFRRCTLAYHRWFRNDLGLVGCCDWVDWCPWFRLSERGSS